MQENQKERFANSDQQSRDLSQSTGSGNAHERLIMIVNSLIAPLGYEVVDLEILTHRQKTLRVFIDFTDSSPEGGKSTAIGIEDCVKITRALDEPLDQTPEIETLFKGAYELEVSSPGVDRPLRQAKDFVRFSGQEIRVHVFRPLTAEESGNPSYQRKNPKQKNFVGTLVGLRDDKVLLAVSTGAVPGKKQKEAPPRRSPTHTEEVLIPLPLISKANLEPKFDFGDKQRSESL